jgi:hypothetical protein
VTIERPTVELKKLDSEEFRKEDPEEYIGAPVVKIKSGDEPERY